MQRTSPGCSPAGTRVPEVVSSLPRGQPAGGGLSVSAPRPVGHRTAPRSTASPTSPPSLGVTHREAEGLILGGRASASGHGRGPPRWAHPRTRAAGSFLVPQVDESKATAGSPRPSLIASSRPEPVVPIPTRSQPAGGPADQLSLNEAARLAGVTTHYLRGLCRRYQEHRGEIEQALATAPDSSSSLSSWPTAAPRASGSSSARISSPSSIGGRRLRCGSATTSR